MQIGTSVVTLDVSMTMKLQSAADLPTPVQKLSTSTISKSVNDPGPH